jgi:glutamate receptor, ionotropic, invertebrate
VENWGVRVNGTNNFSGILGMLQKNQVEFSISPFLILPERLDFVEYGCLTWTTTPTTVFRHPQTGLRNIFSEPLSVWVWWMILIVLFVAAVLITVSVKLHSDQKITFIRALITTMAIFCQQGFIESFRKTSTRILLLTTILFSLIIYQFYSSYIVSSLLTDSPKTIKTLRQLIDSSLKVGAENASYEIDFFLNTQDPISKELYEKKIQKQNMFMSAEEGLMLVKEGGFAFNVDTSYAYLIMKDFLTDEENCELQEIKIDAIMRKRPLRTGMLKRSPLRELLVVGMQRLIEHGIVDYHTKKWSATKPACVRSETKTKNVSMEAALAIFILLAAAVIASFLILIGEIVHFRCVYKAKQPRK